MSDNSGPNDKTQAARRDIYAFWASPAGMATVGVALVLAAVGVILHLIGVVG